MEEKQTPDRGQKRWRRPADTVLLLNWPKALLVLLVWVVTWAISRPLVDQGGILPTLVFQFGATVIPLFLILALAYTIVRTQPRSRYLRLNRYTLLLVPAFIVSAVLHNVLYALFYPYFRREQGDEGPFFMLALIVIPLYFLLVLFYTVVTFIGDKRDDAQDNHHLKGA